jgi:hypothetical protein
MLVTKVEMISKDDADKLAAPKSAPVAAPTAAPVAAPTAAPTTPTTPKQ